MPKPSLSSTCTTGARQFVVQLALEMMLCFLGSYLSWLTPITTVMSSPLAGAEMITFFAPAVRCPLAFSASVNRPVHSMTISTPSRLPRQLGRRLGGDDLHLVAVDDQHVVFGLVGRRLLRVVRRR